MSVSIAARRAKFNLEKHVWASKWSLLHEAVHPERDELFLISTSRDVQLIRIKFGIMDDRSQFMDHREAYEAASSLPQQTKKPDFNCCDGARLQVAHHRNRRRGVGCTAYLLWTIVIDALLAISLWWKLR